jgi:hypothetical protein
MTDHQFGLPQDDPGRIPDRPLPQALPANKTPSPQAIPEQRLSSETPHEHAASTKLRQMESAPHPVSTNPETTEAVPQQNPETLAAIAVAQAALAQAAAALAAAQSPPSAGSQSPPPAGSQSQPPPAPAAAPTDSTKPPPQAKPKRNWGDIKLLAKYYLTVANEVLFSPAKLFAQVAATPDLVEPAVFMAISIGICSIFQIISGDIGGIFRFIGKIFCVLASAFATTYALKALDSKGDFRTLFKIYAYSQAPMIIGWIKLGQFNIGGLIAVGYSMYLSVVGLEQVYKIQRTQASVIVLVVGLVVWGIAKLLGIL